MTGLSWAALNAAATRAQAQQDVARANKLLVFDALGRPELRATDWRALYTPSHHYSKAARDLSCRGCGAPAEPGPCSYCRRTE